VLVQNGQTIYNEEDTLSDPLSFIDDLDLETDPKVIIYRNNSNTRQKITISLKTARSLSSVESIKNIYPQPNQLASVYGNIEYFTVQTTDLKVCCVATTAEAQYIRNNMQVLTGDTNPDINTFTDPKLIGCLEQIETDYVYADTVCAVLSNVASKARRVDLTVRTVDKPLTTKPDANNNTTNGGVTTLPTVNLTKRDIAQRILNKTVKESDYFEMLKNGSPTVYKSIKEKLKYFIPAFHSMTPEGLNSRLTFLQQCMRPGETITKSGGSSCDATNTAFGKPPICVLRIGDLYNTKIIINNLNISYDPLVWDLNPEGIGAQPMIANVQMSFKYLGGSGLREYVEELQNALSFNYYANTDVYDERTYANTNTNERALNNLQTDYFNGGQFDIASIKKT
jgi:hypothetical protein